MATHPRSALLLLMVSMLALFLLHRPVISARCLEDQKSILLSLFSSVHRLSWTPRTDCCSWKGITCDRSTGHVTGIDIGGCWIDGCINSSSLISLSSLQTLNLADNEFDGYCPIPKGLARLSNLTHLNLSFSGFGRQVPTEISLMKSLVSLDLSEPYQPLLRREGAPRRFFASPDFEYLVGNLTQLRELHLDGVYIYSHVPQSLTGLANLSSLHLSRCSLSGQFPGNVFHMKNLESLDVSGNRLLTGALPEFPLESRLQKMSLSATNFSGKLPNSIGNLKFLTELDLSLCDFEGSIPSSVAIMTKLVLMDISSNRFSGEIPSLANLEQLSLLDLSNNNFSGQIISLANLTPLTWLDLSNNNFGGQIVSLENLTQLTFLDLSNNNFSGQIISLENLTQLMFLNLSNNGFTGRVPSPLFTFHYLQDLDLSQNQFDSQLEEFRNASLSLSRVDLSNNKLQGHIPMSIFKIAQLGHLDLSSNNFSRFTIDQTVLQNHNNLISLDLSYNHHLSINSIDSEVSPFPQLLLVALRSCNLTEFPEFLANQSELYSLDLSSNKIDGEIPNWIWKKGESLTYLNLSHNLIRGFEQPPVDILSSRLAFLGLHNNRVSGRIPPLICNMTNLEILYLSKNNISGSIPHCLGQMSENLRVVHLEKNNFSGNMPQSFTKKCGLQTLDLSENRLEGSLTRSLTNCKQLEVLNVGSNQINDSFPFWLGSLQGLRILILRSNNFHGPIWSAWGTYNFSNMQIIDLSENGFVGKLPSKFIRSLSAMTVDRQSKLGKEKYGSESLYWAGFGSDYQETFTLTMKGRDMEFSRILTALMSVDLSNNEFHGDIPREIGNLKSLFALNLSHNNISGLIPSSFGNLLQLESLDLSVNKLTGPIPAELTSLTFLSYLNLSQNHLVGSIPQSKQFLTFSNDSFEDNPELCGPPLSRQCHGVNAPPASKYRYLNSQRNFDWEFIWVGLGFGTGIWMVWGPLIFCTKGRRWYYMHVDRILLVAKRWWQDVYCA